MRIIDQIHEKLRTARQLPAGKAPTIILTRTAYKRLFEEHQVLAFEDFYPESSPPIVYGCPIEITDERMPSDVTIHGNP